MNDVERIRLGIASESRRSAATFVARVFAAAENLETFPQMGRLIPNLRRNDVREIIVDGYRVIYVVEGGNIAVLRVRHGAQQLGDIPGL
jgi:plasmid stabilization system protein ParE